MLHLLCMKQQDESDRQSRAPEHAEVEASLIARRSLHAGPEG